MRINQRFPSRASIGIVNVYADLIPVVAYVCTSGATAAEFRPEGLQVFHASVTHNGDDGCVRSQLLGQSQSGDNVAAGRSAGKQSFFAGQAKSHGYSFFSGDLLDPVGDAVLPERHHKTSSHAIDLVSAGRAAGEDGGFSGLDGDDRDLLPMAAQTTGDPAQRCCRADHLDKAVDLAPV